MTGTRTTTSPEADTERQRTPDRLQARREALQHSQRTRCSSPRRRLRLHDLHDLHETREKWFRLVGPDGQDPTPQGS